ncbi:c-type cytochrome domain-containing protein [Neorhodopirellula pilleata]|nr:c-type cytochrome domain-containing protein [Neorhodopirellula pilleata]
MKSASVSPLRWLLTPCLAAWIAAGWSTTPVSGQAPDQATAAKMAFDKLDTRARRIVMTIGASMKTAGTEFQAGRFAESTQTLDKAIEQIRVGLSTGSPDLYDALLPTMERIVNARALLEFEGVPVDPFSVPPRPSESGAAMAMAGGKTNPANIDPFAPATPPATPANPVPGTPATGTPATGGVSFVGEVAPILASKCGGCHINGSKGGFSLATFAALMKGPPEGVVIFAGDTVGSRLIETIETGDMPRGGGKVSPAELMTLKKWINEGAKFDGTDPSVQLTSLTKGTTPAPAPMPPEKVTINALTGKETVSFASQIAPILVDNCGGCHIDAMRNQGGLSMDTLARLFRGGDSGKIVQAGRGEQSLLVRKLRGLEGDQMPAGGRPPLNETDIKLISTWIDEGASVDPAQQEMPLNILTKQAWLAAASTDEVTQRRAELAETHFSLAGADSSRLAQHRSEHFAVWGDVSPDLLQAVAEQAESALQKTSVVIPSSQLQQPADTFFNGLASIYVLPRRYDYSEFAKMVEGRSVPTDWQSHWKFDGIQAYVAVVASDRDEDAEIADRLAGSIASLAVASRSVTVPRWFADGLGRVAASSKVKQDRSELAKTQAELITAIGTLKSGKEFIEGKLPPERSDLIAAAVCQSFLTRENRRGFDSILRNLSEGKPFDTAFVASMNATPVAYFDAWLQWVK